MTRTESRHDQRSAATRTALLDATVQCLVEHGYAGTTSQAIARRAGYSRGAQLHHFGSRDQMVVAAVEHLAEKRLGAARDTLAAHFPAHQSPSAGASEPDAPDDTWGRERRQTALALLAETLSGPLYAATLELWVAARTRAQLREHMLAAEQRVTAALTEVCRSYVTTDPTQIRLTLDMLLGRGVTGLLVAHQAGEQANALKQWAALVTGDASQEPASAT